MRIEELLAIEIGGNFLVDQPLFQLLEEFITDEENEMRDRANAVRRYDEAMGESTPAGSDEEIVDQFFADMYS